MEFELLIELEDIIFLDGFTISEQYLVNGMLRCKAIPTPKVDEDLMFNFINSLKPVELVKGDRVYIIYTFKDNEEKLKEELIEGLKELEKRGKVDLDFTNGNVLTDFHCYGIECKNCTLKKVCTSLDPNRESYEKFLKRLQKLKIKKEELF